MPKKSARQSSGWKTHQKVKKVKKKTKLALIVLGILIAILLLSKLINFVDALAKPISSTSVKNYAWNKEFNVNFLVGTKDISLVSYKPEEKEILILKIPDEIYLDATGDFGKWQLGSVYDLGESSEVGGPALLKRSLSNYLGLHIDGYSSENLVDLFRQNFFSGVTDLPNIKTDFTLGELLNLKMGLLKVRYDKIKEIDLSQRLVLEKEKLIDGTEVYNSDPIRLDSVMVEFSDPKIVQEHASIAVFNATDRLNLAQSAKRMITNLGGNVIVTQNAPISVPKTYVDGEESKTLERLRQIFELECSDKSEQLALSERSESKCAKIPQEDLGLASQRAQIIVVLGEDFP